MVYARAYFRGEVLAEVSDIGFGTNKKNIIEPKFVNPWL